MATLDTGESPALYDWLSSKRLGKYYTGLQATGVYKPDDLLELTESDLKEIGDYLDMPILIRRRFIRAVESLCPKLEKKTQEFGAMTVPMTAEEQEVLQYLAQHLSKHKQIEASFEEYVTNFRKQNENFKYTLEDYIDSLTQEIDKKITALQNQKKKLPEIQETALNLFDTECSKLIHQIEELSSEILPEIEFCRSANDKCLNAFKLRDFADLAKRYRIINDIVNTVIWRENARELSVNGELGFNLSELSTIMDGKPLLHLYIPQVAAKDTHQVNIYRVEYTYTGIGKDVRCNILNQFPEKRGEEKVDSNISDDAYGAQGGLGGGWPTRGLSTWTAPRDGLYQIDAYGAQGGRGGNYYSIGGKGARICARVELQKGQKIEFLIGRQGINGCSTSLLGASWTSRGMRSSYRDGIKGVTAGSGGGGTFVFFNAQPFLIAAGGNGCASDHGIAGRSFHGDGGKYKRDHDISRKCDENVCVEGGSYWTEDMHQACKETYERYRNNEYNGMFSYQAGRPFQGYGSSGGTAGQSSPRHANKPGGGSGYFGGDISRGATSFTAKIGTLVKATDGTNEGPGKLVIELAGLRPI